MHRSMRTRLLPPPPSSFPPPPLNFYLRHPLSSTLRELYRSALFFGTRPYNCSTPITLFLCIICLSIFYFILYVFHSIHFHLLNNPLIYFLWSLFITSTQKMAIPTRTKVPPIRISIAHISSLGIRQPWYYTDRGRLIVDLSNGAAKANSVLPIGGRRRRSQASSSLKEARNLYRTLLYQETVEKRRLLRG